MRLAEQALSLWTAAPYADCDSPVVLAETSRLEELLVTMEEVRARALIDLGRPDEALRGLAELAGQHPYREGMWSLLALAQYQCSRQADALDTLRRLRERLADELGVDPSEEIRRLEEAVLRQDPALATAAQPTPRPVRPPARPTSAGPAEARPGTIGRAEAVESASATIEAARDTGSLRFLLVAGEPGIGKSRLVADVTDASERDGFQVLVGRCHEGDYAPPLWPWLAIVRALSDGGEVDPLLVPLLTEGEPVETTGGAGTGLRMFDAVVDLRRAVVGAVTPPAGPRGRPLGRRHLVAAAPAPRELGGTDAGGGAGHATHHRGHDQRRARRHPGRAGPGGRRTVAARRTRRRVGRCAARPSPWASTTRSSTRSSRR